MVLNTEAFRRTVGVIMIKERKDFTMSIVIGIDVGGSTTKIVGFDRQTKRLITPQFVRATDPVTSFYGAFGKFTADNALSLSDVEKVLVTGVGASYVGESIYSLPCEYVKEFDSIGHGGLYITDLPRAIVVSMGTGTAIVYAEQGKKPIYLGGTGVGGGTITGLAKRILNIDVIDHLEDLAEEGSLENIDLHVGELTDKRHTHGMALDLTASNFGRVSDIASKADVALGIFNMVFETVAMVSIFAARSQSCRDIVLTGQLTGLRYAHKIFPRLSEMFDVNFVIPEHARFATVIGTALSGLSES